MIRPIAGAAFFITFEWVNHKREYTVFRRYFRLLGAWVGVDCDNLSFDREELAITSESVPV